MKIKLFFNVEGEKENTGGAPTEKSLEETSESTQDEIPDEYEEGEEEEGSEKEGE